MGTKYTSRTQEGHDLFLLITVKVTFQMKPGVVSFRTTTEVLSSIAVYEHQTMKTKLCWVCPKEIHLSYRWLGLFFDLSIYQNLPYTMSDVTFIVEPPTTRVILNTCSIFWFHSVRKSRRSCQSFWLRVTFADDR